MKRLLAAIAGLVFACGCTARADDALAQYVGTYANPQIGITYVITRDANGLQARIVGQSADAIYQSRPDHFYYTAVQAYIQFIREHGSVVGLVLTQYGKTFGVPKLGGDGKPLVPVVVPEYPPIVNLSGATLAAYPGTYARMRAHRGMSSYGPDTVVVTLADGHVFAQITKQTAIEIYPSAKDQFYYKDVDALIGFNRNIWGEVSSLTISQNNRQTVWARRP